MSNDRAFLRKHRTTIRVRWFPAGFPEANPVEECWNQGKDSVLAFTFYQNFTELKKAISQGYRTTRFNLDLHKYSCH